MRLNLRWFGSFYAGGNVIVEGDAKGALDGADVVVDGELKAREQL